MVEDVAGVVMTADSEGGGSGVEGEDAARLGVAVDDALLQARDLHAVRHRRYAR